VEKVYNDDNFFLLQPIKQIYFIDLINFIDCKRLYRLQREYCKKI